MELVTFVFAGVGFFATCYAGGLAAGWCIGWGLHRMGRLQP